MSTCSNVKSVYLNHNMKYCDKRLGTPTVPENHQSTLIIIVRAINNQFLVSAINQFLQTIVLEKKCCKKRGGEITHVIALN